MAQGLDELIEELIGEVAYFGDGCAVSDIFVAIRKYGKRDESVNDSNPENVGSNAAAILAAARAPLTDAELRLGRIIWPHIIDLGDIRVGPTDKWNHLTFDELVSLPEEKADGSGAAIQDIEARLKDQQLKQPEQAASEKRPEAKKLPKVRPRLFVSEETVWKTITGHGIDLTRIPHMEWKLISYIGSTKEDGITQPDLCKATGQDKRSVPRRTDFLAAKGYIVKRTHMTRGMKTSKLWLTRFAPVLPAPTDALKEVDMSKAVLTRNMEPVPWAHQWIGNKDAKGKETLAYHALVQTLVAVIRAWGTLRLRDMKKKLGVMGLRWQMSIVSRFLRRANERGILGYTAAQFPGSNVVFKDCVKFIREPDDDDWRVLLATGKRQRPHQQLTSQRERKKALKLAKKRGRPKKSAPISCVRVLHKRFRLPPSPITAQWEPEKPIANTVAEYVLTGGKEGYTTTEVSIALVGAEFQRYLHKHMSNMCQYLQPPGLSEYQMTSEVTKSGKVRAYAFTCAGHSTPVPAPTPPADMAIDPALAQQSTDSELEVDDFGFASLEPSAFIDDDSMDMASLVKLVPTKGKGRRGYTRVQTLGLELAAAGSSLGQTGRGKRNKKATAEKSQNTEGPETTPATQAAPIAPEAGPEPAPSPAPRQTRRRKATKKVSYLDDLDIGIPGSGSDDEPVPPKPNLALRAIEEPEDEKTAKKAEESHAESVKSDHVDESEKLQDRTSPGVYFGIPGSLNPIRQKKGRPRKSVVMIFRSDKLKDPNFLPGWSDYPRPPDESQDGSPAVPLGPEAPREQAAASAPQQPGAAIQQPMEHVAVIRSDPTPAAGSPSTHNETAAAEIAIQRTTNVIASQKTLKPEQAVTRTTGKYLCEKCGNAWFNDNGLVYHLTKGKNTCNPYYAANPQAMERAKMRRRGGVADSDSASLRSLSPSVSAPSHISEGGSLDSDPSVSPEPEAAPRPKVKKRKPPVKKKTSSAMRLEPVESLGPAVPRPVLKPRSMPKNGRLGGNGIVPRGVEASEAAAKRIAAAKDVEGSQNSAADGADSVGQNGAAPAQEFWKPNEELPYLKHVSAAKSARLSQRNSSEEASQHSSNQEHRAFEVQHTGGGAFGDAELPPLCQSPTDAPGVSEYPAELLDPALRSVGYEGSMGSAAPATTATLKRRTLPGSRLTLSAEVAANGIGETARRSGGSFQRPPPSLRVPAPKYADKTADSPYSIANEKKMLPLRIQEIILHLLTANGGAYPKDRQTLHWSVLKVFRATYGVTSILPTQTGIIRGLTFLERDKAVKSASVAIQPAGNWKQYDIVYLPHVRIKEDPVVSYLKARAEALDPEMYFPAPFIPTEDEKVYFSSLEKPIKERNRGTGRRDHKLDGEIATLNAPYYKAKGIGGVRVRYRRPSPDSVSEDDAGRPKKRRRHDEGLAVKRKWKDGDSARPAKRRRGRKRRFDGDEYVMLEPSKLSIGGSGPVNPGLSSLPASFFTPSAVENISFLTPNTQLEDDYVPSDPSEHSLQFDDLSEDMREPMVPPGTCAEAVEIHARSRGVWPNLLNSFFEENGGSFTMKGWLPTQTERLMENLPKSSAEMGLKLTRHCKTEKWADPAYGKFVTSVDGCKSWELSDLGKHFMSGTIAPDYVFMNFGATLDVSSVAAVKLEWLDKNEWTVDTIPYEQLHDHDDDPYLQYDISSITGLKETAARRTGRPKGTTNAKIKKKAKAKAKEVKPREHKKQRELQPYPRLPEEYFRTKGDTSLGVDWKAEDTRIAAYVAVCTLTGGINKAMDWGIMMRLFPEAKLSNLRKFWSVIRKEREGFINNLSEKFQDEFLGAYEKGELGHFNFDEPLQFDWLKLVKWTLALVVREGIELPRSRRKFETELELLLVEKASCDWRETYHNWQRSVFNKFQDATSEPASMLLPPAVDAVDNVVLTARSWVRALCCTNPDDYDPVKIRDKFRTLVIEGQRTEQDVGDLLENTVLDLEHHRIAIRSKSKALQYGRPYKLNTHFADQLDRYANEIKFSVAADFKLKLDAAFRTGEPLELPWRTEDGMIVAAFNLQAAGRVRIEPTSTTKLDIPFGFRPGFYESRKFPKSHYRFDLQLLPTDRYLYNEDIEILHTATHPDNIPAATADGKLPMWCDFYGKPNRGRWFKMLAGIFFAYATRGAMGDDYMAQALKPCFEQFEVQSVREWGLKQGLLCELTGPGSACTVTEWWWLVLGQAMLDMTAEPSVERQLSAEGEEVDPVDEVRSGRRTKDQYLEMDWSRTRRRGKYRVIT